MSMAVVDPMRCVHALPLGMCTICLSFQVPYPRGCICPPGANKDCEAPFCPRKNPFQSGSP